MARPRGAKTARVASPHGSR